MSSWKKGTTVFGSMVTKADERLEEETRKMLDGDKKALEEKMKKKEISEKVRKNKFTFNKRGKITPKESKELMRTHGIGNVLDWVKKGKETFKEKEEFEEKEEVEVESEPMEIETMEKEERLVRKEKRKAACQSNKICR